VISSESLTYSAAPADAADITWLALLSSWSALSQVAIIPPPALLARLRSFVLFSRQGLTMMPKLALNSYAEAILLPQQFVLVLE
jgi:hypothetical protein